MRNVSTQRSLARSYRSEKNVLTIPIGQTTSSSVWQQDVVWHLRMVRFAYGRMKVRRLAHCGLGWPRKEHCLRSPRQKGQVPRSTSHHSSGNIGCSHLMDQSNKTDTPNLVLYTFAYSGKKKIERGGGSDARIQSPPFNIAGGTSGVTISGDYVYRHHVAPQSGRCFAIIIVPDPSEVHPGESADKDQFG